MTQNPSLKLETDLEKNAKMFQTRMSSQHPYYFSSDPSPYLTVDLEHLRYIKYQPFIGRDSFGTIQECKNLVDAQKQWGTQKMHDSGVLIHPKQCVKQQNKYMLVFDKVIRDFEFWIEEIANDGVRDEDMWEILKKIGSNLIYLCSKNRAHGNLRGGGIAISSDLRPFFLNLAAYASHAQAVIHKNDIRALNVILEKVQKKLLNKVEKKLHVDPKIMEDLGRWISFLSTTCCLDAQSTELIPIDSVIYPLYSPNHVNLVLNYSISWDVNDKLRFLANIYKLCRYEGPNEFKLMRNPKFIEYLRARYSDWPARVTNDLQEVYKYGHAQGNYVKKDGFGNKVLREETIVLYAHDCVRHHLERAQQYNNNSQNTVKMAELASGRILDELYTQFPYLIEDIYEAFHRALKMGGYNHCTFTVAQILTGRL